MARCIESFGATLSLLQTRAYPTAQPSRLVEATSELTVADAVRSAIQFLLWAVLGLAKDQSDLFYEAACLRTL